MLKRTAEVMRSQLKNQRNYPSEIERLEFIANSLEAYLNGGKITLGQAFGMERKPGNQSAERA